MVAQHHERRLYPLHLFVVDMEPLAALREDIRQRDYNDMHRENSPLMKAEDAVEVDTSDMTIEEVTAKVIRLYHEKVS